MIPIYIFYSMFGFQRTGDGFWAAGRPDDPRLPARRHRRADDAQRRGPAARGRPLAAARARPTRRSSSYDPAFSYEVAPHHQGRPASGCTARTRAPAGRAPLPDVMYYLTVYNEPISQPAEPEDLDVQGLLAGMYRYAEGPQLDGERQGADPRLRRRGAVGAAGPGAAGARLGRLGRRVVGDLLGRAAPAGRRGRRAQPAAPRGGAAGPLRHPAAAGRRRAGHRGVGLDARGPRPDRPVRAGRDAARWAPTGSASPTPAPALRRHFHVDAESIVVRTLASLADWGELDRDVVRAGRREVPDQRRAGRAGGGADRPRAPPPTADRRRRPGTPASPSSAAGSSG